MKIFVKALFQAGTGNVIALVLGAISMKILAVIAGPSGIGLFSLLKSLQQALSSLASFSGQTAIIQIIPGKSKHLQTQFVVSVFWIVMGGFMLVALASAVFANELAAQFLGVEMAHLILWLVTPIFFGTTFLYFRSILTAYLEIKAVALINISVGLAAAIVSAPVALGYVYFDAGVLIALLAFPLAVGTILGYVKTCKSGYFSGAILFKSTLLEWLAAKQFLLLAFPSLLVGLIGLTSVLIVRLMVVEKYGLDGAGYFDAAWTISAMYLAIFLSAMQSYLLPSMSAGAEVGVNNLLTQSLRLIIIFSVPLIVFTIVCKPILLGTLYSSEFHLALDVLRWTLLGDYFRVSGWILATYFLARHHMTAYLVHEALWNLVFIIIANWLLQSGLAGVGKAYLIAYAVYLGTLIFRI
jgi:O-antigen/teichoic acid export membrane protein